MIQLSPPFYEYSESFKLFSGVASYSDILNDIYQFESEVQKILKTDRPVIALNSATSALHISLLLAGVCEEHEVLCQSFTFVACANAIRYTGATPIFIGSEPNTWNMCPDALEEAYFDRLKKGKNPKAIIATSLYGNPFDFDRIRKFATAHNLILIDDSAEALGAFYKNKACGTLGDYGIISFNYNKIITASGGGILVCPDDSTRERALYLATQAKQNKPFYHHTEIGYNYRMSHISSQIGLQQLQYLDKRKNHRKLIYDFYKTCFLRIEGIQIMEIEDDIYKPNHWLSVIVSDPNSNIKVNITSIQNIFFENDIETRFLWKPLHIQPVYSTFPYYGNQLSTNLFKSGLCLPSGPNITETELKKIEKTIFTIFNDNRIYEF